MSNELNKTLLKNLKDMRYLVHEYLSTGEKSEWFDPELGICNAVSKHHPSPELRSELLILLRDLVEQWPEFSGYPAYPVPHPSENPDRAFYLASPKEMWSPEDYYGAARLRLLDWLIARLEVETETRSMKGSRNGTPASVTEQGKASARLDSEQLRRQVKLG